MVFNRRLMSSNTVHGGRITPWDVWQRHLVDVYLLANYHGKRSIELGGFLGFPRLTHWQAHMARESTIEIATFQLVIFQWITTNQSGGES